MQRAAVLCLAALLAAGTACGGGGTTKAGGDAAPVTLRMGTNDGPGRPAAQTILDFARRVDQLSGGQLVVEPVWTAAGRTVEDWDQAIARLVVGGELDLALVPSRAWDTEGVTSLRALQAPYLLTSSDAVGAVVTSDLGPDLLSGLKPLGVTGLALIPEGLRHLMAFGEPVLHPTDVQGSVVRAPTSATTAAMFRALGARVEDLPGETLAPRVADGTVVAAESSFVFADTLPGPTTVTGDLVLFPKVDAVVVGHAALAELSPELRRVLSRAALDTRDRVVARAATSERDAAADFCAGGGTVALAGEIGLAAFHRAAEPVIADLAQDPTTRRLMDRIRHVTARIPAPESVDACTPPASEPVAPSRTAGAFPEGTYRAVMTRDALLAAGIEAGAAADFDGVNDLRFRTGRWHHDTHGGVAAEDCGGVYSVAGGRLVVHIAGCGGSGDGVLFSAAWTLDGSQLTFQALRSETNPQRFVDTFFGGRTWEKIE